MKREDKLMHDDGSCTMEGDDAGEYLQHDWEHKKGKGNDEEHTGQFGHDELHNIPHNESPVKVKPLPMYGHGNLLDDLKQSISIHTKEGGLKPLKTGGGSLKSIKKNPLTQPM